MTWWRRVGKESNKELKLHYRDEREILRNRLKANEAIQKLHQFKNADQALVIRGVKSDDVGYYYCIAKHTKHAKNMKTLTYFVSLTFRRDIRQWKGSVGAFRN